MAMTFNFDCWLTSLHACEKFEREGDHEKFLTLLSEVEENMSCEVALALLQTFSDADDFGIQERTRNILEAADRSIIYPALIAELGGIIKRAPNKEWAITLVGIELDYGDFELLLEYIKKSPDSERETAISFLKSEDFSSEYPGVLKYLTNL
ncbi:hypothetical protein [Pseudomonas sichuanensis]|uniref:hypothetical protein n=1 Tax=Pseudomonas sichuanensis TaxID=2213015 RepID=UPI002160627C|nr:hypothetical protein [Pseudomonas sichuanensis]MDZ4016997.1 hypothetical protein [Pseudomonas sichuanensis]UVL91447.1 hypothetical protein LOY51_11430 [Pseudomonas sichuanensis]